MKLRNAAAGALALALAAVSLPALAAAPATSVGELSVTRKGNTLNVEGLAVFGDATDAIVGTDPAGDAEFAGIGGDLTGASIRYSQGADTLTFTLTVGDPIPEIFTIPEVVHYHWQIEVQTGTRKVNYMLQAMKSGEYMRVFPNPTIPLFRVNSCGKLASGGPSCFDVAGYVDGTMGNGIVQWVVPAGLIGAGTGGIVAEGLNGVYSAEGASGVTYVQRGIDAIQTAPFILGPVVQVTSTTSAQAPASGAYKNLAALGDDGTFFGKISIKPNMLGRDHVIYVRACNGAMEGCGVATQAIHID